MVMCGCLPSQGSDLEQSTQFQSTHTGDRRSFTGNGTQLDTRIVDFSCRLGEGIVEITTKKLEAGASKPRSGNSGTPAQ